jgi:enamine deaminase RidA (YjgF/YER057c/UK114 family)
MLFPFFASAIRDSNINILAIERPHRAARLAVLKTGAVMPGTIEEETRLTMSHIDFQGVPPARTAVQSVLGDGIKVEIDAAARLR